jgi:hypothetical protein
MTNKTSRWLIVALGLLIVVGLPLAGHWARSTSAARCALDGVAIDRLYQVRVVDADGHDHVFCCIHCATTWLGRQSESPRRVFVTDEVTGQELDAASAWFVRSLVVTSPHTGNRVHVFAHRADALRHAAAAPGTVLRGSENPFASATAREHARARSPHDSHP